MPLSTIDTSSISGLGYGFKNRIINGAMTVNQRATSVTDTGYVTDRWQYTVSVASKATVSQDTSVYPTGFNASLKVLSSSAYTVGSGEVFAVKQAIEGFNFADMGWGTASAQSITISFWVRSSLTGTFGGALQNGAQNRSYPFTYTISAANTWEQKTVTIAGDTSGTWVGATNGVGVYVFLGLGCGSSTSGAAGSWAGAAYWSATGAVSVVGTNAATFYITGVQLEKGTVATSFDWRPYGTELALCQRYFVKYGGTNVYEYVTPYGLTYVAGSNYVTSVFPVEMRSAPTVAYSTLRWSWQGATAAVTSVGVENASTKVCGLTVGTGGGETAYRSGVLQANNSASAYLTFSSEL